MKNKLISALIVVFMAGVFSCADEEKLSGLPKQGPVVTPLDIPGLLFAGVVTDVSAKLNGTLTNPVSTVTFEVFKKGSTTVQKSGVITPLASANTGVVTVTWTGSASGLSTLAAGDYVMQVTGSNANGKTVGTQTFTVPDYVVPQSCQVVGQITIIMLTPQALPPVEVVGAVGSFAGSGWGADTNLVRIKEGVYCAPVPLVAGDEFKFRLNGSWGTQEKKDNCNDGDNRKVPTGGYPQISIHNVPKWGGYGC